MLRSSISYVDSADENPENMSVLLAETLALLPHLSILQHEGLKWTWEVGWQNIWLPCWLAEIA
jgi:hypothetical protein